MLLQPGIAMKLLSWENVGVVKITLPPGHVNVKVSQAFNVKCSLSTLNKVNVEIDSTQY